MGLATPAAIMASANTGRPPGHFNPGRRALEKAGNVTAVIFDKTGTLTMETRVAKFGKSSAGVSPANENERRTAAGETPALLYAATLARHSTHPSARRLPDFCDKIEVTIGRNSRRGREAKLSTLNSQLSTLRLGSLNGCVNAMWTWHRAKNSSPKWSGQGADDCRAGI